MAFFWFCQNYLVYCSIIKKRDMSKFSSVFSGITFTKRTNRRNSAGMVKEVYSKNEIRPMFMFCASDDVETIYKRLMSWSSVHSINLNSITKVTWS